MREFTYYQAEAQYQFLISVSSFSAKKVKELIVILQLEYRSSNELMK